MGPYQANVSAHMVPGPLHSVLIAQLVVLNWLSGEAATAYAVVLHAIMMVILIIFGAWGLSRLDLNFGELMAEVRRYAQRSGEDPEAEVAQETAQGD